MMHNGREMRKAIQSTSPGWHLQDLQVLEVAESYRNMIKFRALIGHRYEQIEAEILATIVHKNLDDFGRFARKIQEHES